MPIITYNHGEGKIISNIKPIISEQPSIDVLIPETLKPEDCPGVGKLLVGPNGPVDANAAAKVAAAGTMPKITLTTPVIVSTPVTSIVKAKPITPKISAEKVKNSPKQSVLRCDCCYVTVNSQNQLDLHLNGK